MKSAAGGWVYQVRHLIRHRLARPDSPAKAEALAIAGTRCRRQEIRLPEPAELEHLIAGRNGQPRAVLPDRGIISSI